MKNYKLLAVAFLVLVVSSFAVTDAFASVFNIININRGGIRGIRTQVYFESANASTASSPITVNTATAIPSTTSSYMIPPGTSVYLWTPQFSTADSLPASKMTLGIWATLSPELDGQASTRLLTKANSITVSLTTTRSNDLIYVAVAIGNNSATVSSISGRGLTWQLRGTAGSTAAGIVYTYYAIASSPLTAAPITVQISSNEYIVLTAFGVSGIDTTNPFDSGLSQVPAAIVGAGATASASFNAKTKNDFIIGAIIVDGTIVNSITGAGFTTISKLSSGIKTGATEYQNGGNSGIRTVTFSLLGTGSAWALIGDALVPASAASSSEAIKVSVFTTTSAGVIQDTLVNNQDANPTVQLGNQLATTFSTAPGTVPESGYIQVVLTAPSSSAIIVHWGKGQPTNIQICTAYSSQV
jgi:hypothetical protein